IKNKKAFLVGKVGYNNSNFTTYLKLEDTYTGKFVINGNGKVEINYLKYDAKYDFNSEFNGNFNLEIDTRNDKNNANVYLNINNKTKDIFKFNMTNEAQRTYKNDVKIEAPKDYKDFDVEKFSQSLYGEYIQDNSQNGYTGVTTTTAEVRDLKRLNDLKIIQLAIEQYYFDIGSYPSNETLKDDLKLFLTTFPKEVNEGQIIDSCEFGYIYGVSQTFDEYVVASCMETDSGKQKAKNDGGLSDKYIEFGNGLTNENIDLYFIEE
ncbi:MAG: hypothetical protein PHE25_02450, partial [Candidatus Gracilibacteria bacterium]|nr:hypothetical protein [Candidatus Gracilibacteria bacterium]